MTAANAACARGRGAGWEGWVVLVDGTPVIPYLEEPVPFGLVLVDVGKFLDQFAQIGGGAVEEGEEAVE